MSMCLSFSAASYCSKRTPDTVDTFTTLSSAVSNISTLSSNNKHNITDVSASNTTLNTPTHSAPATQAAALSFVEMKPLNIRGCVGERVTFKCSDWNTVFGKSMHRRQTHHHQSSIWKDYTKNRMLILNTGNDLFVTFTNLKKSDANIYYCGVKRNGLDLYIKVNLKVTDAASYCPKRTPDTADTFTTLSSAVSNISTLSSNNKHNITDVSASNTTLNTPTHSAPATQAAAFNIRGCVGERVTFKCSDWNTVLM
ncbi:hypothetical protein F7725_017831 [Dissostichus mawsoni]|uniref:Ig-like domain-containing protein n=1 Tax=Dissostichus mawsoni TaxID=36200 RepID=A0A7J5XPU5_DISMA|nr:hypothetical protein F7725_017831 [Dissostichus mawsoni]